MSTEKTIHVTCDRCGAKTDFKPDNYGGSCNWRRITQSAIGPHLSLKPHESLRDLHTGIDLCTDCCSELSEFLKKKTVPSFTPLNMRCVAEPNDEIIRLKKEKLIKEGCLECSGTEREPVRYIRHTQFSGSHLYCEKHAKLEKDFNVNDPSYRNWEDLGK